MKFAVPDEAIEREVANPKFNPSLNRKILIKLEFTATHWAVHWPTQKGINFEGILGIEAENQQPWKTQIFSYRRKRSVCEI